VLGTTTKTLQMTFWNMIGWTIERATTSPYTITLKVLIDGELQFTATSALNYHVSTLRVGFQDYAGVGAQGYFDDLAVKTFESGTVEAPLSGKVLLMKPNGVGTYSQWVPSTVGNHYVLVDEVPCSVTDYVMCASSLNPAPGWTPNAIDSYELDNPSPGKATNGCCVTAVVKKDSVTQPKIAMGVRSGSSNYTSASANPGSSWALQASLVSLMPIASDVVASLQSVLKDTSQPGDIYAPGMSCAQVMVHLDIAEPPPNAPINLAPAGRVIERKPTFAGDYSQGDALVMAGVEVQVYAADGVTLVWDSGALAATGTHWLVGYAGGTQLALGTTYKWRARCMDAQQVWGPTSALVTLNINAAPSGPSGCQPTGGATVGETPTLSWVHVDADLDVQTDAQYEIRKNSDGTLVTGYPETSAAAIDTFTRATAATLGNDESQPTGKPWSVLGASSSAWGINGTDGQALRGSGAAESLAVVSAGAGDGTLRCRVRREGTQAVGLAFRCDGTVSNYWKLDLVAPVLTGIRLRLSVVVGGAAAELVATSSDLDWADALFGALKVVLSGSSIAVYLNEAAILNVTDARLASNGRHGLYCPACTPPLGRWDDFSFVTPAAATGAHVVPGGRLSIGNLYQWKVKTRDGWLWGPESAVKIFNCTQAPVCLVTHPSADHEVETSPVLEVTWDYTGLSAQSSLRVVVYDESLATVIYDSGQQAGSDHTWTIPMGYLRNDRIYQVKVYAWDSEVPSTMGESAWRIFDTQWAGPTPITGVTATEVATGNPHVRLTWDASTLGSDFVEYSIYRRLSGETEWTRVAEITDKAIIGADDYLVNLGATYEYSVRQTQNLTGDLVESADSLVASASMVFYGAVIHDVTDPASYVVLEYTPSSDLRWRRQQAQVLYWGRTAPTVEFGPARYRVLAISYALLSEDSAKLEALAKLQADRNILCYRDGRGEKVYCNFDEEMQTGYTYPTGWKETIGLVETDYVEVIA